MVLAVFCASEAVASMASSCLNGDSNPDLCDSGAVLFQLSYQINWERVVIWVDYGLVLIDPHSQPAPSWPDSSTTGAIQRNRIDRVRIPIKA